MTADALEDRASSDDAMMLADRGIDPVVPDERIREDQQLAVVGRIGERFFVSGHAGEEHRFAFGDAVGPEAGATIFRTVGKQQERRPAHTITHPATTDKAGRTAKVRPANGVVRPFERNDCGSTVHGRSRYRPVMSAGEPTLSVPPDTPSRAATLVEKFAIMASSGTPKSASNVAATAVSRPLKPTHAWLSGGCFSSSACGA